MSKAVVYSLLAAAFLTVLTFAPGNNCPPGSHLRLSRRFGHRFRYPTFDPLVLQREREADDKRSGSGPANDKNDAGTNVNKSSEGYVREEEEEETLNTTLRLMVLFPLIDKAPADGSISAKELHDWNVRRALERSEYTTRREMASRDTNGDGVITFSEYLPQFSAQDIEIKGMGHGEAGWWMNQFNNADADSNGVLDLHELNDLLHPEDSENEQIHRWLLGEKIKRMDEDGDGKLNFKEFLDHVYRIYKSYAEFEAGDGQLVPIAEEKFVHLDLNRDKLLEVDELKPILQYLYPGELSHAKHYTTYLINEVDDNLDGSLSLEEMLNHEHVFYNTIYEDEDDYSHDEL